MGWSIENYFLPFYCAKIRSTSNGGKELGREKEGFASGGVWIAKFECRLRRKDQEISVFASGVLWMLLFNLLPRPRLRKRVITSFRVFLRAIICITGLLKTQKIGLLSTSFNIEICDNIIFTFTCLLKVWACFVVPRSHGLLKPTWRHNMFIYTLHNKQTTI